MAQDVGRKMDAWLRSIHRAVGSTKASIRASLEANTAGAEKALAEMNQPKFFEEIVREFVEERMVGSTNASILRKEWTDRTRQMRRFYPRYIEGSAGWHKTLGTGSDGSRKLLNVGTSAEAEALRNTSRKERVIPGMDAGIARLWSALRRYTITQEAGGLKVGIGPGDMLMDIPLSPYMILPGMKTNGNSKSDLNSLFMAVEFGTGTAQNVGGERWVRKRGRTKDASGDGTWWLGPRAGQGVRLKGQEGFHFLYDVNSREPLPIYRDYIRKYLPSAIDKALKNKFGRGIRRR